MSDSELDYERAPEANKAAFLGFWRYSGVTAALVAGIALFLFAALVAGNLMAGLLCVAISIVVAIIAALRL